jgi:hypothetical protein
MEKVVYLITSHIFPQQVVRLARAIKQSSPNSMVVIHHDRFGPRLQIPPDLDALVMPTPLAVQWGSFSQVEAFLQCTTWVAQKSAFDWLVNVSGQDYVTGNLELFERKLLKSPYDAFIEYFPVLEAPWPPGTGEGRYYYQYWSVPKVPCYHRLPEKLKSWLARCERALRRRKGKLVRFYRRPGRGGLFVGMRSLRHPFRNDFVCYGGSDWFNLSFKAVATLHEFVRRRPDVLDYYRKTAVPSESFVHTVLLNTAGLRISNELCRFIEWPDAESPSPRVFDVDDLPRIIGAGCAFARKFDPHKTQLLDALDAHRINNHRGSSLEL